MNKRLFTYSLIVSLSACMLAGCGEKKNSDKNKPVLNEIIETSSLADTESSDSVDTKYIPKSFTLGGEEYKIGDKVEELMDAGFAINKESTDVDKVKSNSIEVLSMNTPSGDYFITTNSMNNTDKEIDVKDGIIPVMLVNIDSGLDFILDNGIKLGDDISKVHELYEGQKESELNESEYTSSIKYADVDGNSVEYHYSETSKKITQIDLFCYQYSRNLEN